MTPTTRSAAIAVLAVAACAAATGAAAVGPADAVDWKAVAVAGTVEIRPAYESDETWTRVRTGDELAPLSSVRTRRGGRATLATEATVLMLHPDTTVELPATSPGGEPPQALHEQGSVTYEVRDPDPLALEVVTPYLVAQAGGAVFRVDVGEGSASVRSLGGSVRVTSRMDGSSIELVGGQATRVQVGSNEPLRARSAEPDPLGRAGRRIDDRRETSRAASVRASRSTPDPAHR